MGFIFTILSKIFIQNIKRYFSLQLRLLNPFELALTSFSNRLTRRSPINAFRKAINPARSVIGARVRKSTGFIRRFLKIKNRLDPRAVKELSKVEKRFPRVTRNRIREIIHNQVKLIQRNGKIVNKDFEFTTFPKSPYSWLKTMYFEVNQQKSFVATKKKNTFNLDMNRSIFEAMSKSASPGRVLWNTIWLWKRKWYSKPVKRLIPARILFRNKAVSTFNKQFGVRKYQQLNRKW